MTHRDRTRYDVTYKPTRQYIIHIDKTRYDRYLHITHRDKVRYNEQRQPNVFVV